MRKKDRRHVGGGEVGMMVVEEERRGEAHSGEGCMVMETRRNEDGVEVS